LDELPEPVRIRVITLAASALGAATPAQVPAALAAVARFAPAKRARRGSGPLARALETDPAFRALVAHTTAGLGEIAGSPDRAGPPDAAAAPSGGDNTDHTGNAGDAGDTGDAEGSGNTEGTGNTEGDDVGAVALAYLRGTPMPTAALDRVAEASGLAGARLRILELERQVDSLTAALSVAARDRDEQLAAAAADAGSAEADRLRGRLREQGTRVRQAELAAEQAQTEAAAQVTELSAAVAAAERARDEATARADAAVAETERIRTTLAAHRDSGERTVAARDRRIDLLLTSISAAAAGLRREWDLASGGELPADLVARQVAKAPVAPVRVTDPNRLADLLSVPGAHLIVDGYNVTKTGYPELTLADQRERLIRMLSTLRARTSAEITVVFDGAAVSVTAPQGRKIRVLFSPPGVIADDVIRRLVAAEPAGRLVAVATSDRAVANDVGRSGARTAGSDVLLALLGHQG
jgi:predicted RNA-binding protein with PIN domain